MAKKKKLLNTGAVFQGRPILYELRERAPSTGENSVRKMPNETPTMGQVAWDIDGVIVYAGTKKAAIKKARKKRMMTENIVNVIAPKDDANNGDKDPVPYENVD